MSLLGSFSPPPDCSAKSALKRLLGLLLGELTQQEDSSHAWVVMASLWEPLFKITPRTVASQRNKVSANNAVQPQVWCHLPFPASPGPTLLP